MSYESAGERDGAVDVSYEVTLTGENTFPTLPGAMLGVTCPSCWRDQLLREVLERGSCTQCGAPVEVRLAVGRGES